MRSLSIACIALILALLPLTALGQSADPAQVAEAIRADLSRAQLALTDDPAAAVQLVAGAAARYEALAPVLVAAPDAAGRVRSGLAAARAASVAGDTVAFAAARAQVWTALLDGAGGVVVAAIQRGDGAQAQVWLRLREFRHATRFSRPDADATLALERFAAGGSGAPEALAALRADLLDTYQARLSEVLGDLVAVERQGFAARRAEAAALAEGYFSILAPAYGEQRGAPALAAARQALAELRAAAVARQPSDAARERVEAALQGFRAAPLSPTEQTRRAGQLLRFLSLVPVEYSRGVSGGSVTKDLEIREASTFSAGAAAAFADLRPALEQRGSADAAQAASLFNQLELQLAAASSNQNVPAPGAVQATTDQLVELLGRVMPAEWQQHDSSADFDVIQTALDQMEAAVASGEYAMAESARLEAYAILESGPEAKLVVFAPQYKPVLEGLFWYGQDSQQGLAYLIGQQASAAEIRASRRALDAELAAAQQALAGNNAPVAVASNAAIIVFREGLEAVLILASLMGSMKIGEQRRFRRPLWVGAVVALAASALTWLLARGALTALARYGERLEAVVSLVAIAVLLLITNWFFHDVYWKGWMSGFHQQKRRIIGGAMGQWLGLVLLGFTSIYREGFETVLFLQALVLESGPATVLGGVAVGLGGTLLIGLLVFAVQARLPHKKMLIVTGVMIGAVLLQMVGNTAHVLQVVGWLSIHPIRWLNLPYWAGMWFGLYATWEGIGLQVAAGGFTIGSYFLAERLNRRKLARPATQRPAPSGA